MKIELRIQQYHRQTDTQTDRHTQWLLVGAKNCSNRALPHLPLPLAIFGKSRNGKFWRTDKFWVSLFLVDIYLGLATWTPRRYMTLMWSKTTSPNGWLDTELPPSVNVFLSLVNILYSTYNGYHRNIIIAGGRDGDEYDDILRVWPKGGRHPITWTHDPGQVLSRRQCCPGPGLRPVVPVM